MIDSLSKTFGMTGWRLGYLAPPPGLSKTILKFIQHSIYCVPGFVQARRHHRAVAVRRAGAGAIERCSERGSRPRLSGFRAVPGISLRAAARDLLPVSVGRERRIPKSRRRWLDEIDVATVPGSSFGARRRGASAPVADLLGRRARRCARPHRAHRNCGLKRGFTAVRRGTNNDGRVSCFLLSSPRWLARLCATRLAAAAQAPHGTLAKIKERGKLLAGVKLDTPPFGFLNDKNEPAGFDIDLVRKIGERIGVPVELVKVTSPTRIPLLVSGNVDLVAASMTHTRERDKAIDFSITYYTGGQSLLVPKASPIGSVKDLGGKQVAVQQGTTLEKNIAAAAPTAKVVAFRDYNRRLARAGAGPRRRAHRQPAHPAGLHEGQSEFQDRRRAVQRRAVRGRRAARRFRPARRGQFRHPGSLDLGRICHALSQVVRLRPPIPIEVWP